MAKIEKKRGPKPKHEDLDGYTHVHYPKSWEHDILDLSEHLNTSKENMFRMAYDHYKKFIYHEIDDKIKPSRGSSADTTFDPIPEEDIGRIVEYLESLNRLDCFVKYEEDKPDINYFNVIQKKIKVLKDSKDVFEQRIALYQIFELLSIHGNIDTIQLHLNFCKLAFELKKYCEEIDTHDKFDWGGFTDWLIFP